MATALHSPSTPLSAPTSLPGTTPLPSTTHVSSYAAETPSSRSLREPSQRERSLEALAPGDPARVAVLRPLIDTLAPDQDLSHCLPHLRFLGLMPNLHLREVHAAQPRELPLTAAAAEREMLALLHELERQGVEQAPALATYAFQLITIVEEEWPAEPTDPVRFAQYAAETRDFMRHLIHLAEIVVGYASSLFQSNRIEHLGYEVQDRACNHLVYTCGPAVASGKASRMDRMEFATFVQQQAPQWMDNCTAIQVAAEAYIAHVRAPLNEGLRLRSLTLLTEEFGGLIEEDPPWMGAAIGCLMLDTGAKPSASFAPGTPARASSSTSLRPHA